MIVDVLRLYARWGLEPVVIRESRKGPQAVTCCPLHGERHPSFSVNMVTGGWSCFSCHARGKDVESLIRAMEGFTSTDEVRLFIATVGTKTVDEIRDDLRAKLQARKELVARRGQPDLTATDEWEFYAQNMHRYLKNRGFGKDIIRAHRLGYDPIQRAITIPVFEHGTCRFMYRRFVDPMGKGAYRYPFDIDKSNYIWGLDRPAKEYRGKILPVHEGALDALWVRQCGIPLSTAILGSFMSEVQARKIAAADPAEVVLFFDADEAGYDATEHAGKLLQTQGLRVSYCRYTRSMGSDPATCTAQQVARAVERRKSYHHFRLASKVGRNPRIRRLQATAKNN